MAGRLGRTHPRMSLGLALALVLTQSGIDARAVASAPPRFEVFGGLGGEVRGAAGAGGQGVLGANVALLPWLKAELLAGGGALGGAAPLEVFGALHLGARFEWAATERVRPWLWAGFAHLHQLPATVALAHPVSSMLGLSDDGLVHRSGAEAGVGVSYELPKTASSRMPGRLAVRVVASQYLGGGNPFVLWALATAGLCF
jgi:hypothetical protein